MTSNQLAGRVALVTGASRGIGAAIARRLAAEGAAVAVVGRTLDPGGRLAGSLAETVALITEAGGRAQAIQADLADPAQRSLLVPAAEEALGPVDILVNNAAASFLVPVAEFPEKRYRLMMELQVTAPFEVTQAVLPGMLARGEGWILNISSRGALHPAGPPFGSLAQRGFTVYGMCKAALERFSTGLAAEVSSRGVRVNALAPWDNVATPGTEAHDLTDVALEDVSVMAEAALLLSSGDITGQVAYSIPLLTEHERVARPL